MIGRPNSGQGRTLVAIVGDALVAAFSLFLVVFVRRHVELSFTRALMPAGNFLLTFDTYAWFVGALIVGLASSGFYNRRVARQSRTMLGIAFAIQVAIIALAWTFLTRPLPRTVLIGTVVVEALLLGAWHRVLALIMNGRAKPVVLVGSADGIRSFLEALGTARRNEIEIVGIVAPSDPELEGVAWWGAVDAPGIVGKLAASPEVLFVSTDDVSHQKLRLLAIRGPRGFLLLPSSTDSILTSSAFGWIGDQPLVEITVRCGYGPSALLKRTFDLAVAAFGAVVSSPLWLFAAVAIWLEDRQPVFIRQPRVGRDGRTFMMWKFRTMKINSDSRRITSEYDERVTRVGLRLRRHRIDELPQLINVMAGEMSLVGPRPEQPQIMAEIVRELPEFELRSMVRPGIAGLAQVSADYHTRAAVKLRYDLTYMQAWSLWLDLRILMRTVSTVISGRGI